jgi:hypothetical protein
VETFGYAGGTNGQGTVIAAGGFDPDLSLFDSSGNLLDQNDDGTGFVAVDSTTGNAFDSYLTDSLGVGSYTVALTESPNFANGPTLGDSFLFAGQGDFTCSYFLGSSGAFCDASFSQRNGNYALDITTPGVSPPSATPEPASLVLTVSGVSLLFLLLSYRQHWRTV